MQKYALLICFADYYWKGILFLSNEVLAWNRRPISGRR